MSTQARTRGLRALVVALALAVPAVAWPQQDPQYGRDYIIVTPGMTLTRIMRDYYAQHRQHWPVLMDEIIRRNPHAFVNNAPASLKRGMRLSLPREIPARRPTQTAAPTGSTRTTSAPVTTARLPSATAAVSALPSATAATAAPRAPAVPAAPPRAAPAAAPRVTPQPVPAPQPVAALPPPVEQPAQPGQTPAVAEQETSERPPWWWTLSALAVALLVL